jgi:hypothetical protein
LIAGLLAKHFGGALPFDRLEQMTRRQMARYYQIYEYQAIEEEIRNEHLFPKVGKPKELPKPERMAELVRARIESMNPKTER